MPAQLLTTGKAALRCSVKPDTVLKWIKKGILPAVRTAGGHYRVDEQTLAPFLPKAEAVAEECPAPPHPTCTSAPLRCWEYMSERVCGECNDCVVYQTHAAWCFELVSLVRGSGHVKRFCTGSCLDCPYFRRSHYLPTNVLIITHDEKLIQTIATHASACVACRFARNGYDASGIISVFRPALVIIGERTNEEEQRLVKALVADSRAPGVRVLLGVRNHRKVLLPPDGGIAGTIDIPFTCEQLAAWTGRLPVETVPDAEPPADPAPQPVRNGNGRRPRKRLAGAA